MCQSLGQGVGRRLGLVLLAGCSLGFSVRLARADRFSWEWPAVPAGDFADPNSWHGPNYPEHTRFPGAGDDASISGNPRVRIAGDHATRELVTSAVTFEIAGSYSIESWFSQGSPLMVLGPGSVNLGLWNSGGETVLSGALAQVRMLQPFGSVITLRDGAWLDSQDLDLSRGALKVRVEGAGSLWQHAGQIPVVTVELRSGGEARARETSGVFVDAADAGTRWVVAGQFSGLGRLGAGAVWESGDALQTGLTRVDGGSWTIHNTYINQGTDLEVTAGGRVQAKVIRGGIGTASTAVEGAGSRLAAEALVHPVGSLRVGAGARMEFGTAELSTGGLLAQTEGRLVIRDELYGNSGVSVQQRGALEVGEVFLGDTRGRFGSLQVEGEGSRAEVRLALAVGQNGEGQLVVRRGGRVTSGLGGFGIFAGSDGSGEVSGPGSEWTVRPQVGGGALLVGDQGVGRLRVEGGGGIRCTTLGDVVLGRQPGGVGSLIIYGAGSLANLDLCEVAVGRGGRGTLEIGAGGAFTATRLGIGGSSLANRVQVSDRDSVLAILGDTVVGEGGTGELRVAAGAKALLRNVAVGRRSSADNLAIAEGEGTEWLGARRVDVGEFHGRGTLVVFDRALVRPGEGLSVGIYEASQGTLKVSENGSVMTPGTAIVGGGERATATAELRSGGSLNATDVLLFAMRNGESRLEASGPTTSLAAGRDLQVGFMEPDSGPAAVRTLDNALISAAKRLMVGPRGVFDGSGGRTRVGTAEYPAPGVVRIGAGGRLSGLGRVVGEVEVEAGGVVAPGASPGGLTVGGNLTVQPQGSLELEVGGPLAESEHDQLKVEGAALVNGRVQVAFIHGFAPRRGQEFTLIRASSGLRIAAENVQISGLEPGFSYRSEVSPDRTMRLIADSDGQSASAPMLAVRRVANGMELSWWVSARATLESKPAVGGAWASVPGTPELAGDRYRQVLPTTGPGTLFRLVR